MKKYSKKLIYDYIMGNSITGYNIDELENDYEFIKEVIDLSNDKNMYNLLDNNLKRNFDLIKFIIFKFKEDEEYCKKIALNFNKLSNNKDDIFEINIIIFNLYGENNTSYELEDIKNWINARAYYYKLRLEFDLGLSNMSKKSQKIYQTGFIYFKELYNERPIIIDFFAKSIINDAILNDENFNFEKYIHKLYKNKEDIQKIGKNNILLNFIKSLDTSLYEYAQIHIEVLDNVKNELIRIENKFNSYNDLKNKQLIEWIKEYILNYCENSSLYFITSDYMLLNFIAKDLNIPELKDDGIYDLYDEFDICYNIVDENENEIEEYEAIKNNEEYILLKNYIKNIYVSKKIPDDYEEDPFITYIKRKNQKILNFTKKD